MAQYDTIRTVGAAQAAQIDEGLRAHMTKVYGLMSVAMVLTVFLIRVLESLRL